MGLRESSIRVPSCRGPDVERETTAKIAADFRSERTLDAEISTAPAAAYVSVAILRDELSSEMDNDGEFDSSMAAWVGVEPPTYNWHGDGCGLGRATEAPSSPPGPY